MNNQMMKMVTFVVLLMIRDIWWGIASTMQLICCDGQIFLVVVGSQNPPLREKQTDRPHLQISAIFGICISIWQLMSPAAQNHLPPPTFVFSTEPTRDWQMVKSESLMPTIPRYHPPPPHIGPVSWKNPIFKRDCARGSAPTELIQLFLKFCRYSCGGDRYRQRDILRSKQTEILPSTWFPFQILLIIYPSDHNLTWITTEELGIKTHIVIFISIIWYHIIFIGICLVRDFLTHQAMSR